MKIEKPGNQTRLRDRLPKEFQNYNRRGDFKTNSSLVRDSMQREVRKLGHEILDREISTSRFFLHLSPEATVYVARTYDNYIRGVLKKLKCQF